MTPFNCPVAKLFFLLLCPILVFRYIFHLLFAKYNKDYTIIIQEANIQADDYRVFTSLKDGKMRSFLRLMWALHYNPQFLACFYSRLRPSYVWICSFFKKNYYNFVLNADNAGVLHIHHPFSTIINAKSIGNNVIIRHNTTIGNKGREVEAKLRPTIGDNVDIGAGAIIFGNITIGSNVIIGAGTLINKNIPSGSIVVGNPMRFIKQGSD